MDSDGATETYFVVECEQLYGCLDLHHYFGLERCFDWNFSLQVYFVVGFGKID